MKITIENNAVPTPFSELKVGEVWMTTSAHLDKVNTLYVKISDDTYTELGGSSTDFVGTVSGNSTTKLVRRVEVRGINIRLV